MNNKEKWLGRTGKVECFGFCKIKYESLKGYLGKEHFLEDDVFTTHSGIERYWVFKINEETALAFLYSDLKEVLWVGSNHLIEDKEFIINSFIPVPLEATYGTMWD